MSAYAAEELLACAIARLVADAGHVAVGAASPIPATGAFLARLLHNRSLRISLLHQRAGNPFTEGSRELLPDFGKALVILGERPEADGQAWHVPNDNPRVTQREMVTMIATEMGVPPKFSVMGKTMTRIGGLFIPEAKEQVEMMYEFEKPFIVDSSRFERTFGMTATPMKEAIKATVAWYKSHPKKH